MSMTKAEIETICCDCERPQKVIGQIFESARESGEEDNQTAILYVNQERKKDIYVGLPQPSSAQHTSHRPLRLAEFQT